MFVLISLLAAAVTAACGSSSSASAPSPSPSPVTAASVADAVRNSTMKSGHFTVVGTITYSGNPYSASGFGVIQRLPDAALQLSLKVDTKTSLGVLQYEEINVGGVKYFRVGTGSWHSAPSTFGPGSTVPSQYVAEETVSGVKCWHAQSIAVDGTYDIWVKESDGYIPKIAFTGTDGSAYTLTFDSYNTGPAIVAPAAT